MQNPQGRVVSAHSGPAGVGEVMVEVEAGVICERCESGKGCGAGLLGGNTRNKLVSASVAANIDLSAGDLVRISLQPSSVLQAAIIVYGYPLAGAVLGVVSAYGFKLGDAGAAFAAILGVLGGFLIAKAKLRNARCLKEFTPMVLEKLTLPAKNLPRSAVVD